jgi:hypothetical protein
MEIEIDPTNTHSTASEMKRALLDDLFTVTSVNNELFSQHRYSTTVTRPGIVADDLFCDQVAVRLLKKSDTACRTVERCTNALPKSK